MPKITAVIYDIDGLLLDSEIHYTTLMEEIAGREVPSDLRIEMFGRKPIDAAKIFIEGMDIPMTPKEFLEMRKPRLRELFSNTELFPGAKELINHLHENNIKQGAATGSNREMLDIKISKHQEIFFMLECIMTSDEVTEGKPDPEIYLKVAECLKVNPEECLVLEDSLNGIKSAKAANMITIAIPHPLIEDYQATEADQVLNTLKDFKPQDWGLPAI